jgi:hypothetical protein
MNPPVFVEAWTGQQKAALSEAWAGQQKAALSVAEGRLFTF